MKEVAQALLALEFARERPETPREKWHCHYRLTRIALREIRAGRRKNFVIAGGDYRLVDGQVIVNPDSRYDLAIAQAALEIRA